MRSRTWLPKAAMAIETLVESGRRLAFRHVLIRDAIYLQQPADVRAYQHRRAARALAAAGSSTTRVAEQLLLLASGREGSGADGSTDPPTALDGWALAWMAQRGGELVDNAPDAAVALLERALVGVRTGSDEWRALSVQLVGALWRLSRHAELELAAIRLARDVRDPAVAGWAAWMVASAQRAATRYEAALAVIATARAQPNVDATWSARLHALASAIEVWKLNRFVESVSLATAALAEAEQVGDPIAAAYALFTLSAAVALPGGAALRSENSGRGYPDAALGYLDRALTRVAGNAQAADIWLNTAIARFIILTGIDDLDEAARSAPELLRLVKRRGTRLHLTTIRISAAELYELRGEWDQSLAELAATELDSADPPRLLKIHGLRAQQYVALVMFCNPSRPFRSCSSFTVCPTKQFYHCFGCGAHGTAVGFLMEYGGLGFVEAVKELAQSVGHEGAGSPLRDASERRAEDGESLHEVLLRAAQPLPRPAEGCAGTPSTISRSAGLSGEIAKRFGIGYAPDEWQNLAAAFTDYDGQDARRRRAGEGERRRPALRRVPQPHHVPDRGRARQRDRIRRAGAGRRASRKYLNSPETPVFEKGRELYGLYQARRAIRDAGRVLVVEGYMDVVALAQAGVEYAVATLGTATTPLHVQKLLRQADEIVFCFDGDAAGRRAAWRALEVSLAQLADGKQVRFLFLPEGEDPGHLRAQARQERVRSAARAASAALAIPDRRAHRARGSCHCRRPRHAACTKRSRC